MSTSSEITQACNPTPEPITAPRHQTQGLSAKELPPVSFRQSRRLWQLELAIYLSLLFCASLALFPFVLIAWYWPVTWCVFALLIGRQAWNCWQREFPLRSLYCTNERWYLRDLGGEREIMLCDEILLWPQLIVLPVRTADGYKTQLLFTPDAMTADDWRRLRVWLRFWSDKR